MTIWLKGLPCVLGVVGTGGAVAGGYFFNNFGEKSKEQLSSTNGNTSEPEQRKNGSVGGQKNQSLQVKGLEDSSNSVETEPRK